MPAIIHTDRQAPPSNYRSRPGTSPEPSLPTVCAQLSAMAYTQLVVAGLTQGGRIGVMGVAPLMVPGIELDGGGAASAEKPRIDAELTEYVTLPLGEIQATWFG